MTSLITIKLIHCNIIRRVELVASISFADLVIEINNIMQWDPNHSQLHIEYIDICYAVNSIYNESTWQSYLSNTIEEKIKQLHISNLQKKYCYCESYHLNGLLISCQQCKTLFHITCTNIKIQGNKEDECITYHCQLCKNETKLKNSSTSSNISYDSIIELPPPTKTKMDDETNQQQEEEQLKQLIALGYDKSFCAVLLKKMEYNMVQTACKEFYQYK